MPGYKSNERRRYKRLKVGQKSAAISIGNKEFPILEMSSGGFSSNYLDTPLPFEEALPTYILLNGLSIIGDISVQLTWQKNSNSSSGKAHFTSKVGFKFNRLSASQQLKLEAFLKWHTNGPVLRKRQPAPVQTPYLSENKTKRTYTPLACVPPLSRPKRGKMASSPM